MTDAELSERAANAIRCIDAMLNPLTDDEGLPRDEGNWQVIYKLVQAKLEITGAMSLLND